MAKKKKSLVKKIELKEKIEQNNTNQNRQLYWILGTMLSLVLIFFISYYIFNTINKFEYQGLTFTKEKFGEIPVFHHYYSFNSKGQLFQYNLYLRNDPRKNNVPITGSAIREGIELSQNNFVYLSVAPENLTQCEYARVGISQLASFLSDNQLNVKGATTNESLANESNVAYATCETHPDDAVIIIKAGNETKIIQEKRYCHIIEIANCEVLQAIEKFQLKAILDARERKSQLN